MSSLQAAIEEPIQAMAPEHNQTANNNGLEPATHAPAPGAGIQNITNVQEPAAQEETS
jgi:hypothetical protein